MKLTYIAKIRVLIVFLLLVSIIQVSLILNIVAQNSDINTIQMKIQNTILITIFIQFVLAIILVFYIPVFLKKAFLEVENLLKDINKGLYTIDIVLVSYKKTMDKNFYDLIVTIKNMLRSIHKFDKLKKSKVIEHHNRINTILKLSEDGFIILDITGKIIYINDNVIDVFPNIQEKSNLVENLFSPDIENSLKKYTVNVIKNQTKQKSQQFFIPTIKRHLILDSGIIRDSDGITTGAIIALTNLPKKKQNSSDENKEESN